jgi:mannose-6-phosphate isomerase-like protein (cupin superfamily)
MRVLIAGFAVILTASAAFAQQPPAPAAAAASRTMVSASDVTALIAKAKAERKDNVSLEYRAAVANAAVHETEAELFYVIDGSATLVTGGKLTNENRTNAANLSGSGIEGGVSRRVAKGDFIMVPEGTPHWFSAIDGTVVLMSLHLPHSPQR